jgi:hypothetical protein
MEKRSSGWKRELLRANERITASVIGLNPDRELYLPEEGAADEDRCRTAAVPEGM